MIVHNPIPVRRSEFIVCGKWVGNRIVGGKQDTQVTRLDFYSYPRQQSLLVLVLCLPIVRASDNAAEEKEADRPTRCFTMPVGVGCLRPVVLLLGRVSAMGAYPWSRPPVLQLYITLHTAAVPLVGNLNLVSA